MKSIKSNNKMELRKRLAELTKEEFLAGGKIIIKISGVDYAFDYTAKPLA